jgi:hypothetical protein
VSCELPPGLSQRQVAERMVELGCTGWLQSTVAKTEAASRPLRLNEFVALCRVFDQVPGVLLTIALGPTVQRNVSWPSCGRRVAETERDVERPERPRRERPQP